MSSSNSLWFKTGLFAVIVFLFATFYASVYRGNFNFTLFSEVSAFIGGILIGTSFLLSSISYFFNFLDFALKYRREIGIYGYIFALAHAISLLFRFPDTYIKDFPHWLLKPDAILGLTAMFILSYMTIISTKYGMQKAGKYFRPILRTGYIAYGLLVIRAYLIQSTTWYAWLNSLDTVPPPRLLLSVFAVSVIGLRIIMEIHVRMHKKEDEKIADETITPVAVNPSIESPQNIHTIVVHPQLSEKNKDISSLSE